MGTYNGGGGNDVVNAGSGNDTVNAYGGNDTVNAYGGADAVYAGDGADSGLGGSGNDTLYGGTGNDTLQGDAGYDISYGGAGDDSLVGAADAYDDFYGGDGNDTIRAGDAEQDWAWGESGNDSITMGAGADSAWGGSGSDTVYGGLGNDKVQGGGGTDSIGGDAGQDVALGGAGNDTVDGGTENDTVMGGSGSDVLYGGTGDDLIRGDSDSWDSFDASKGPVDTTLTVVNNAAFAVDLYWINESGVQQLIATIAPGGSWSGSTGASHNWFLTETGSTNPIEVIYGAPNQTVTFSPPFDDTIYGGAGNDTIFGDYGNDVVSGDAGNDSISTGTGNDSVFGGDGNDTVSLGAGDDRFGDWTTEGGDDNIDAGSGNDSVIAAAGNDTVTGGDGNDSLSGGIGQDILYGGAGSDLISITDDHQGDTIYGGESAGDWDQPSFWNYSSSQGVVVIYTGTEVGTYDFVGTDGAGSFSEIESVSGTVYADTINAAAATSGTYISSGDGTDLVTGGSGADTIFFGTGNDTVYGGAGNDQIDDTGGVAGDSYRNLIDAGDGDDTAWSGGGEDTLYGGAGKDLISAEDGNDLIYGGDGNDSLYRGQGNDTVDGGQRADLLVGDAGDDLLTLTTADFANDAAYGGAGNDTLTSRIDLDGGSDTLYGGDGRDVFTAGAGDSIAGGEGGDDFDTLDLSTSPIGGTITLTSSGTGTISGGGSTLTFSEIESITASAHADLIYGGGDTGGMTYSTGAGNDTVTAGSGSDSILAGDGDDRVGGGAGDDTLSGGAGNDTATFSGPVADYSFDYLPGGSLQVTDSVAGRDGTDTLTDVEYVTFGTTTYRLLTGDDGTNTTLQGPEGEPALIIAHDGNDWGGGHATSDAIFGGAGNDTLDGGDGNDTLVGEADDDLLRGDAGNDQLFGGTGRDTLQGGAGDDTLSGGAGNDLFTLIEAGGGDTVTDFEMALTDGVTTDRLDVSSLQNPDASPVKAWDVTVTDDGNGNTLLSFPEGESLLLQGVDPATVQQPGMLAAMGVPCFAAGTRIATPTGLTFVEKLRPGDLVLLARGGAAPILWAGQRHLAAADLAARPNLRPVRIRAGQHGALRDLTLSPQHAVEISTGIGSALGCANGRALVRAGHLARLNWQARLALGVKEITYHHILLPQHAVILAEGVLVETLFPGRNALAGFLPADRATLLSAIANHTHTPPGQSIIETYGPRCLPLLSFAKARDAQSRHTPPITPQQNRFALTALSPVN